MKRERSISPRANHTRHGFVGSTPNGKIPVIRDSDTGRVVWGSAPILIYLVGKFRRLLPTDPAARLDVLQWLFFQAGRLGPMRGQFNQFTLRERRTPRLGALPV